MATAAGIGLAIAALYFGRDIFIPLAVALLLSFTLAPVVGWLRKLRLPNIAAIIVAVLTAFIVIAALSLVVGSQLVQLAENLPGYQRTITEKIRSVRSSTASGGILEKLITTATELKAEISNSTETHNAPQNQSAISSQPARSPVPVTIKSQGSRPLEVIQSIVGPLIAQLATAGLVIVLVVFMLIERQDLRDRFFKLFGGDLQKTTEAISLAADRVSRYLLMQLLVNISYAMPMGVGLYFIGVPNAVLWALLAGMLRFIPYLGPFLAAMFPLALAIAVDPGWSMLFWTIGLIVSLELVSNNVVEPWLYGASTGISSFAIIVAAIFWTTLWGPVGLLLSTPLTVCLVVIGRYVPRLEFLDVLLGSEPVLAPEERFYQRLLAGNIEEAVEIAETYVDEKSAREFYDDVAIPALRLAENDRQRPADDNSCRRMIADGAVTVVYEVSQHVRETGSVVGEDPAEDTSTAGTSSAAVNRSVLCIGGRTELDRAASEMIAQLLGEHGIGVRVQPPIAVTQDAIGQLDVGDIQIACISYLNPQPHVFARYVCRRLKRRSPRLKTIVCFWNPSGNIPKSTGLAAEMEADAVAFSMSAAENQISNWLADVATTSPMVEPAIPEDEQKRLKALRDLRLTSSTGGHFDDVAARVAEAFGTPIALVSLIDEQSQLWPGATGLPSELDAVRQAPRNTSICGHVVASKDLLVVEDIAKDERFANNPFLLEKGIRFYAGAPLCTSTGYVLGSLCVIDTKPRRFSDRDRKLLQIIADELIAKVEVEAAHLGPAGKSKRRAARLKTPLEMIPTERTE